MSKFIHQDCILHHISKDIIEHDIFIFIQYEFERIRKKRLLVLDVPDALNLPVRLIHPSFRDFLLDKNRCTNLHFLVDERQAHRTLADGCIRLMSNSLKQDVCRQVAPGTPVADVESS